MRYRDNGGVVGPPDVASVNAASGVWSVVEEETSAAAGNWPLLNPPFVEYLSLSATGGSYTSGIEGVVLNYPYNVTTYNPVLVIPYNTTFSFTVGSLTVISYPLIYEPIRNISAGLIYAVTRGTQRPGYYVYRFTAGSGAILF